MRMKNYTRYLLRTCVDLSEDAKAPFVIVQRQRPCGRRGDWRHVAPADAERLVHARHSTSSTHRPQCQVHSLGCRPSTAMYEGRRGPRQEWDWWQLRWKLEAQQRGFIWETDATTKMMNEEWTVVPSKGKKGNNQISQKSNNKKNKKWQLDGTKTLRGIEDENDEISDPKAKEASTTQLYTTLESYRQFFSASLTNSSSSIAITLKATVERFLDQHQNHRKLPVNSDITCNEADINEVVGFTHLIALGIGSLSSNINSHWQFALFLYLQSICTHLNEGRSSLQITCYDPAMSSIDISICEHFGIAVLQENNKGMLSLPNDSGLTLIYMPHCPYRLYCNVLWSFWNKLSNVLLVGNSFQSYALRRSLNSTSNQPKVRNQNKKTKNNPLNSSDDLNQSNSNKDDPTDSVAIVTPFINETLLPSTLHNGRGGHFLSSLPATSSSNVPLEQLLEPSLPRHIAEAAFCELSVMFIPLEPTGVEQDTLDNRLQYLCRDKPSVEILLEATKQDVEVF